MIEVATKINSTIDKEVERNIIVTKSQNTVYNIVKRLFDIVAGLIGTIILIPLTLFVIALRFIKNEYDGPIFYEQLRIGKDGKVFRFYKFRTMYIGADKKLEEYLASNKEAREEYKINKKLRNDPRITKVGKILRKTSLDEFPQFLNVLMGHMHLVGPRPYLIREKEDIGGYYKYIIQCKPGITGYWQVNGRNNTSFEKRLQCDQYYIQNKSLKLDLKIILKTITTVIKRTGAI